MQDGGALAPIHTPFGKCFSGEHRARIAAYGVKDVCKLMATVGERTIKDAHGVDN